MNHQTLPGTFALSCCLFLSNAVFGSAHGNILVNHHVRNFEVGDVQLAPTAVVADRPSNGQSSEKDKSAPEDNAPKDKFRVPDSYVGTVVGLMLLAGVAALVTKWPRHRIRKKIYEFGRGKSREHKRRAS
jgi:hypothetical protein